MFPLSTTADLQLALKYYFSMINASNGMYLNWENFKQQALTFGVTAYFHRQRAK
jgi:hypothetical protein